MPRRARSSADNQVFHVLNRGNCRMNIFGKAGDYGAFVNILEEGRQRTAMRILAYCLMGNHWHLILWPRRAEDLSKFMQWISTTHVRRWREHRKKVGEGHLYQGRFKNFPVQDDHHLLTVMRNAEANPLRAKMVERAQDWRWSSLGCEPNVSKQLLDDWPIDRPRNWTALVNEAIDPDERKRLQISFDRGRPLGSDAWTSRMAARLHLQYTLNPRGRPKKKESERKRWMSP